MKLAKSSSSILKKFLVFNSLIFLVLGLFTFFYLKAIQPDLVKQRTEKHTVIINNTSNHIERLKIKFDNKSLTEFLLSTRFLFQNLERVQFYNIDGFLVGDTNVLDLDQTVFSKTDVILEEEAGKQTLNTKQKPENKNLSNEGKIEEVKNLISKKDNEPIIIEIKENNNFYVKTLDSLEVGGVRVLW